MQEQIALSLSLLAMTKNATRNLNFKKTNSNGHIIKQTK